MDTALTSQQNVQPTIAKPAALLRKLTQLRSKVGITFPL